MKIKKKLLFVETDVFFKKKRGNNIKFMNNWLEIFRDWVKNEDDILEIEYDLHEKEENDLFVFGDGRIPLDICQRIFKELNYYAAWVESDERVAFCRLEHFIDAAESFIDDLQNKDEIT